MNNLSVFSNREIEEIKFFIVKYGPLIKRNNRFFISINSKNHSGEKNKTILSQISRFHEKIIYLVNKEEFITLKVSQNTQIYILKTIIDLFNQKVKILEGDILNLIKIKFFIKRSSLINSLKECGYSFYKNRFFIEIINLMKKNGTVEIDKIYLSPYIILNDKYNDFIEFRRDIYNKNSRLNLKKKRMSQFYDIDLFRKLTFTETEIEDYQNLMEKIEEKDLFKGRSIEKIRKSALWVILKPVSYTHLTLPTILLV